MSFNAKVSVTSPIILPDEGLGSPFPLKCIQEFLGAYFKIKIWNSWCKEKESIYLCEDEIE